jgi:hypothetical protein
MSPAGWAHAEAIAQNVIGCILAQFVLFCFGVPIGTALGLNIVMFAVSYARTYVIRRVFDGFQQRGENGGFNGRRARSKTRTQKADLPRRAGDFQA